MVGIGSIWLRIRTGGGLMWRRWWTSGFHKMLGSSRVAAQLAASQEGPSSMSECEWDRTIWCAWVHCNNSSRRGAIFLYNMQHCWTILWNVMRLSNYTQNWMHCNKITTEFLFHVWKLPVILKFKFINSPQNIFLYGESVIWSKFEV
jgi:hypothetical protein